MQSHHPSKRRTNRVYKSLHKPLTYPLQLKFDYTFKANEAPFDIESIYHDDKFTYIKTNAPEKFSIYEMKDGKPNLVSYDLRQGTDIIPKVMDSGYVQLGKKKMDFTRKG